MLHAQSEFNATKFTEKWNVKSYKTSQKLIWSPGA